MTPIALIMNKGLERAITTNGHQAKRLEDSVFQAHSRITVKAALAAGWAEIHRVTRKRKHRRSEQNDP